MEQRTGGFARLLGGIFQGNELRSKSRAQRALRAAVGATFEALEGRRMLSANVVQIKWAGHVANVFENQYVALARPGVDFTAVAERQGFSNVRKLSGEGFWSFESDKPVKAVQRWSHQSARVTVSPNYQGTLQLTEPNDPKYLDGSQWHLKNTGQIINNITGPFDFLGTPTVGKPDADIDAPEAWDITQGSARAVQLVVVSATAGTFTLSYNGVPSTDIAFNASAATVKAAIDTILPVGATDSVSLVGTTYRIQFSGLPVFEELTADTSLLTGTVVVSENDLVVAVMDSGIDPNHPDLKPNIFVNPGDIPDGVDNDGNGYVDDVMGWNFADDNANVTDLNGHGTHVSGIIGAVGNNAIGVSGVNWRTKIMPLDIAVGVTGLVSFEASIEGINYTASIKHLYDTSGGFQGANVVAINASFGGGQFPFDHIFSTALDRLAAAGVLFVAAAGNDAINLDNSFDFPAKFSLNHPGVITVAATDNTDHLAFFSNTGAQTALLAAPGVSITSTTPTYPVFISTESTTFTQDYGVLSGTSQATPVVTGILALEKAANPAANYLQLRSALLNGVDVPVDPVTGEALLGATLSGARKVATAGRANAYKAVQNILNEFIGTDNSTHGNWAGPTNNPPLYGREGRFIAGESTSLPAITGATVTGATTAILKDSTPDERALQSGDTTTHIAGELVTSTAMTFDFNFTDANPHRVALYMVDFDRQKRSQVVDVIDPNTGEVLSGEFGRQSVSNFQKGRWLIYELRGHVQLRVTRTGGPNAVVSGVFVDPVPTNPQELVGIDSSTSGNWRTRYGSQGAYVVGASNAFPTGVIATVSGATTVVRQASSRNPRGLENPADPNRRVMAYLSTPSKMTLDLNFADTNVHRVSFYVADFEKFGRAERIEVLDPTSGGVEAATDVADFGNGKYVTFDLSGHKIIRITKVAGPSAVLSGVLFDAPASAAAQFIEIDSTTRGDWKSKYGADAKVIVGDTAIAGNSFSLPLVASTGTTGVTDTVDVTLTNAFTTVIAAHSHNKSALLKTANSTSPDRIIAGLFSHGTETIDLNFHDSKIHRVALYALDNDREHRIEIVKVVDPSTGTVLVQQTLANFQGGKYVSFDVKGHVQIQVQRVAGQTAVVNGIFFD